MITILRGLAVIATLAAMPAVRAEFVVDDFALKLSQNTFSSVTATVSSTVYPFSGVERVEARQAQTVTGSDTTFNSDNSIVFGSSASFNPNGRFGELRYKFATPKDLNSINKFLSFGYSTTALANVQRFTVQVFATSAFGSVATQVVNVAKNTSGTLQFNMSTLNNGLVQSNVTDLTIRVAVVAGGNAPNSKFVFSNKIVAAPELGTLSLLGLSAIGGVIVHRRKKRC
jgi:hypothetical protein